MTYKPLYIFMSPASIPQIVAHIQDYLVKNPIVSTETVAEIVVKALSEHPELINGSVIPITEDSQQTIKEYIDALPTLDAYTKAQVDALLSGKQDTLTFDQTPTADSTNPVTSGGVASALAALNTALTTLISSKADLSAVYTKTAVDLLLSEKADADDVYSKNTIDAKLLQYPTTENVYTKADIDLMKQVNKANIAIASTDGTAPVEILAGQYVYLADVLYMATETIQAGSQLIPEGNITINPRGVTNRIGDGLKNAATQINGLADRMTLAEGELSSQSQQITTLDASTAKVRGISSGSLYDITVPGIYYLTSVVTDKPTAVGGVYILGAYDSNSMSGIFIEQYTNKVYIIRTNSGTHSVSSVGVPISRVITSTTTATGAFKIPDDLVDKVIVEVVTTDGTTALIFRRDAYYLTLYNSLILIDGAIANREVTIKITYLE